MKARLIIIFALLAYAFAPAKAQRDFPYPSVPDTLRSVKQRASYLCEHYWDNFNFADTLLLQDKEMAEQGFVNFIDILARFDHHIATEGVTAFSAKAYTNKNAKEKFESLIEHYYENPESPMRNDRIYILFLKEMALSPYFDEAEKERIDFRLKAASKNLPGTIATDFTFTLEDGKQHKLSDYKSQKVILYLYDPDCENCHKVSAWLSKQQIPADITMLRIIADARLGNLYSLKAMPTIYLLDKENKVVLKDCTPEQLIERMNMKEK